MRKETTPPSPPWPGSGPYLGFRIHVENRSCSTFSVLIWFRSLPGDQDPCWEKNLLDLLRPDLVQVLTWSSGSVLRKEPPRPSSSWSGSGPYLEFRIRVEKRTCSTFFVLIWFRSLPGVQDPCWEKKRLHLLRPDLVQVLTWSSGSMLRTDPAPPSLSWSGSGPYLEIRIHVEKDQLRLFPPDLVQVLTWSSGSMLRTDPAPPSPSWSGSGPTPHTSSSDIRPS